MADAKQSNTTQTPPEGNTLDWYGLQFYCRARGNGDITQRSFPFWAPSVQFAIDHAKKSNKLSKEERTHWTHVVIHAVTTETSTGSTTQVVTPKEYKI